MAKSGRYEGRRRTSPPSATPPDRLWIMLTSRASEGSSGGSSPGKRAASMDLPAPGGPIINTLWPQDPKSEPAILRRLDRCDNWNHLKYLYPFKQESVR